MNVTVVGTGFVGVVSAAVFSKFGNIVYALDIDKSKINQLQKGKVPFYEPNLEDLIQKGIKDKNLHFTTSYETAIKNADVIIIAVGTPSAPDGQADLKYVFAASKSLAPYIKSGVIIGIKSTVPPGTNEQVSNIIKSKTKVKFATASLPEFLKEGSAVNDSINADRVVIGATEQLVINTLLKLHRPLKGKKIIVTPESAQMAKYAANAYLAQRITFINQIANLCDRTGADVNQVTEVIGADRRIGSHYWYPGLGYGGSCFPKDVRELAAYSKAVSEGDGLFVKIDDLNEKRLPKLIKRFESKVGGWQGKKVAVLGLSFKPNTDDMREAPSLKVISILKKAGATISAYDPISIPAAKKILKGITYTKTPYEALEKADVAILLVEWDQLISLDPHKVKAAMKGNVFIDTRNQYDPQEFKQLGLIYIGVGRS